MREETEKVARDIGKVILFAMYAGIVAVLVIYVLPFVIAGFYLIGSLGPSRATSNPITGNSTYTPPESKIELPLPAAPRKPNKPAPIFGNARVIRASEVLTCDGGDRMIYVNFPVRILIVGGIQPGLDERNSSLWQYQVKIQDGRTGCIYQNAVEPDANLQAKMDSDRAQKLAAEKAKTESRKKEIDACVADQARQAAVADADYFKATGQHYGDGSRWYADTCEYVYKEKHKDAR